MRLTGFRANVRVRGRACITDTDETVTVLVDDAQPFPDPTQELKGKTVVFATVAVEVGSLESPREVGFFRETAIGGRNYKVLEFDESAADGVAWKFKCEAQRLNVPTDEQDAETE
jgi:hypothetical protein